MRHLEIYYTDINEWKEDSLFEKGLSLVQPVRQEKALACRFAEDRCRSLAAGLLIRYVCLQRGLQYETLQFCREASGKPWVRGLKFNVSHAGDYAAIIVGELAAGIDVERLTSRFSGEKGDERLRRVVKKTFDEKETAQFEACRSIKEQPERALACAAKIWTRKESYAKACGAGLGMDFQQIHTLDMAGFHTFELPEDHVLSVFVGEAANVEFPVCVRAREMLR